MKSRTGFVSNSSSSSFVLVGFNRPDEEIIEKVKALPDKERGRYLVLVDDQSIRCDDKDYDGREWWDESEVGEICYLGSPIMVGEGGETMSASNFLKKTQDVITQVSEDLQVAPKELQVILTEWSH